MFFPCIFILRIHLTQQRGSQKRDMVIEKVSREKLRRRWHVLTPTTPTAILKGHDGN